MGDIADMYDDSDQWTFGLHPTVDTLHHSKKVPVICRYCGSTGVRWRMVNGKWRLFERHGIHICPKKRNRYES